MRDPEPVLRCYAEWTVRRLGDLVSMLRRGTAPVYVDDSDVMAIGQRCITDADFDASRSRPHSAAAMSRVVMPEVGDVLINSTGTGTIGRSVVFRDGTGKYIVDGHVTVARPRRADLMGRWLSDVLRSPQAQRYLEARCYAGSTNQIELSSAALAAMPIAIPCVDEQRHVTEILDTIDSQIRATELVTEKLVTIESATLDHLLSDLPRESYVRLADRLLVPPKNGYSPLAASESTGEYMLGLGCLTARGFVPRQLKHAPRGDLRLQQFRLLDGDVLVSRSNTRDLVGLAGIFRDVGAPCYYPDLMMRLVPSSGVSNTYLATVLNTQRVRRQIMNVASGTSDSMVKITKSTVEALTIPIPSRSDQNRIEAATRAVTRALDNELNRLNKLRLLKAGLMSDLLTGRVRPAKGVA